MAVFEQLPDEIFLLVMETFWCSPEPISSSELVPSLLVCSRWYRLVMPYFYRNVTLASKKSMKLFLSKVSPRPELARQVRRLTVVYPRTLPFRSDCVYKEAGLPDTSIDETLRMMTLAGAAGFPPEEVNGALLYGQYHAQLMVLLLLLPNLKWLHTALDANSMRIYRHLFRSVLTDQPAISLAAGLQSVEELKFEIPCDRRSWDLIDILPAFLLPRARTIKVGQVYARSSLDTSRWLAQRSGQSSVRALFFGRSHIETGLLEGILRLPSKLEELSFIYDDKHDLGPLCQASDLGEALGCVRHSLVQLELHISFSFLMWTVTIGSLAEFSKLERLSLSIWLLLEVINRGEASNHLVELLPSSIRHLHLELGTYYHYHLPLVVAELLLLVEKCKERLPGLQCLTVETEELEPSTTAQLKQACQLANVELKLESPQLNRGAPSLL